MGCACFILNCTQYSNGKAISRNDIRINAKGVNWKSKKCQRKIENYIFNGINNEKKKNLCKKNQKENDELTKQKKGQRSFKIHHFVNNLYVILIFFFCFHAHFDWISVKMSSPMGKLQSETKNVENKWHRKYRKYSLLITYHLFHHDFFHSSISFFPSQEKKIFRGADNSICSFQSNRRLKATKWSCDRRVIFFLSFSSLIIMELNPFLIHNLNDVQLNINKRIDMTPLHIGYRRSTVHRPLDTRSIRWCFCFILLSLSCSIYSFYWRAILLNCLLSNRLRIYNFKRLMNVCNEKDTFSFIFFSFSKNKKNEIVHDDTQNYNCCSLTLMALKYRTESVGRTTIDKDAVKHLQFFLFSFKLIAW